MADTVLGITYKGGVIIAADQSNGRSILTYQKNLDKIAKLTDSSMMGVSGPNCDLVNFTQYIAKNINLYELSNEGTKLSTHAQANFARGELAAALRRGPYQVNVLLGGYDESNGEGSLYMMDYLGSLHKVKHGAQGYAQYFCSSIFDKEFDGVENCTEEDAVQIIEHCIKEIQTRFMLSQPNFIVKKVDKDGIKVLSFGEDPADN
mmetsp:Transcript_60385/g.148167  ORF Transcript_60385/g.148167 Transcript_60385/m.148167 type:complete len:205 (-) Transcript_60385:161-775(-)|eukprot:CAMPEP_0113451198 /NCGR_PEP_ID=MMETSP0014_2-20120614/6216_1 /TAXON_ID=2857 /ORGANISM="Nitzschia sp." /LENGTH=204 /DNA_ID=CAMNT_0000342549 /DNA_START=138 /DNA_END=752 /DNA_ORIENTATION=+ /assembly_acc=CAM_ASM_000159